ncbi:MAG: FKBP-type peptidyl-prolyl cis-trans isomerase [Flavobacteriales bacterium]
MRTLIVTAVLMCIACGDRQGKLSNHPNPQAQQEQLIKGNQEAVREEDRQIDRYVRRAGIPFERTARGIRYVILRDVPGPTVQPEQWVTLHYRVELLNGDTAYSTATTGPESFRVERDDVESGLHEGVQLLSPGDSAIFILPSFRAHGIAGDRDRIPMRSSVVYRVGVVKVERRR